MGSIGNILYVLLASWGTITVVLVAMMFYRSALENREEDQLFLNNVEKHVAVEQRAIISRIQKLQVPIVTLMVLSGALLVAVAGVWLYHGLLSF